ncbi:type II secretion system protein GspD [Sphingomonas sp.]|uniref:type II secretion system protein GspD n=1 Tax=Sphingomonas sp. TaxID=28214 RepID=UPI0038A786F4
MAQAKRISLLIWLFVLALLGPASPALAAQAPVPSTVALTKINLVSQSDREAHLQLVVEPRVNGFQALSNNARDPTLALALTARMPSAVSPRDLHGFVRGIEFVQAEGVLVLHFQVDKGATVAAVASSDRTIEVTIGSIAKPIERAASGEESRGGSLPPAFAAAAGQDSYALVLLKYADVSEVVGLLSQGAAVKSNDVFIPREPQFGSNSLTGTNYQAQTASQAPGSSDEPLGQSVDASMSIDRRLNAVWLRGSPDYIARMKEMIAAIDIPVDSVILETQMVELNETGSKALGIDFANSAGQIGVVSFRSGEAILPGVPAQGCDFEGANCSGHMTSASFQAAIYAQITKGNGRIVSKPRIAAQSGSTAKIITGDALPILTSIALSGVNGVQQQVQYVNVGVTLQIAPRVSTDGFVSSHVYCVVSSVTGFSQGYPTISQRQAETAATVRDGDSFVIGGLIQDENLTTKTKVPLLGDIPLLGQAFRTDKQTRSKTELYIIVTPHIVHGVGTTVQTASRQQTFEVRPASIPPAPPPAR